MEKRGISFYLVRFIAGGLLLLLLVSAETAVLRRTVLAAAEPFSMTAREVTDDITVGWNLGNSLDSYDQKEIAFGAADLSSETVWGNPLIIRELITSVRESGFDVVRLPVTWYTHMDPETYEIDPAWMARVREVVDFILDEGMYCILNVHHDTGVDGWLIASKEALPRDKEILTSIWVQLCEEFGDYGDRLIFEGYNEILDENKTWDTPGEEGYEVANELNQLFVDVVRASGGNNAKRILYVNTYCASCYKQSLDAFAMPEDPAGDDRIIAGVHIYRPYDFTHEDFPKVREWTESEIDIAVEAVRDRFVPQGIPVLIGEFGCADKNNDEERITWANYFMRAATKNGLKAVWWDEGNRYKLYNRYTGKVTEPEITEAVISGARGEVYNSE